MRKRFNLRLLFFVIDFKLVHKPVLSRSVANSCVVHESKRQFSNTIRFRIADRKQCKTTARRLLNHTPEAERINVQNIIAYAVNDDRFVFVVHFFLLCRRRRLRRNS